MFDVVKLKRTLFSFCGSIFLTFRLKFRKFTSFFSTREEILEIILEIFLKNNSKIKLKKRILIIQQINIKSYKT